MGIKKSKVIYVTDRGDNYYVEDMENSHLANTITHIQKKMDALIIVKESVALTNEERLALVGHIECLLNDRNVLAKELASRESCKDVC